MVGSRKAWVARSARLGIIGDRSLVAGVAGPIRRNVADSVGVAIRGKFLARRFGNAEFRPHNFDVYAVCGDGDVLNGSSDKAARTASSLMLSNLCWIYDCNHVTIEAGPELAFADDVGRRFLAHGWAVVHVPDAGDIDAFSHALNAFERERERPTLIVIDRDHAVASAACHDQASHRRPAGMKL